MKVVQVADAGNELALHLEYVRHGGTVRIVDHGQAVADLVPVLGDNDHSLDDDAMLVTLESIRCNSPIASVAPERLQRPPVRDWRRRTTPLHAAR